MKLAILITITIVFILIALFALRVVLKLVLSTVGFWFLLMVPAVIVMNSGSGEYLHEANVWFAGSVLAVVSLVVSAIFMARAPCIANRELLAATASAMRTLALPKST